MAAYSGWVSSMSARWRPAAWDVVLAVGLLLLGLAQIHAPDPHRVIANPTFSAIVWTVTAMSLAWRRRFPWVTFTVVIAGLTVEALPAPDSGTLAGFVALLVALWTVARVEPVLEKTVGASAVALLALLFHYARDPMASNAVESIQATYAILIATPVCARIVSSSARHQAELEVEVANQATQQLDAARAATVAERARISRELHDVIAHSLSVAIVQSMAAQSAIADGASDDALRRVAAIENSARQTLADMRRLVTIDADDTTEAGQAKLGPQPGMADVPALVQQLLEAGADVSLERSEPTGRLSPGADLALFRITQEALTNALNHAPGAQIRVRVIACDQGVELEVVNGPARRPGTGPGSGRGLIGMRQRADMYQGTLLCGPDPSGGFSIRAQLPTDATRA